MTTPIRPVPTSVARWISRLRWLRWLDAVVAGAGVWTALVAGFGPAAVTDAALAAALVVGVGAVVRPLRARWRPISAWVTLAASRDLRVGDRAWYVGGRDASLVLVTARHRTRLVIARPDLTPDEGLSVRRTRVLLLAADER